MPMSLSVKEYAFLVSWFGITSIYTTLFTVTILALAIFIRKRRSSILKRAEEKQQRAPRMPFSELEFKVATPQDTNKSRRVSFSKRKGVAEFSTNEATTTWKNFYEEHNRTLESSGNDSQVNGQPRQVIGHIGRRTFENQFQEDFDFMTISDNPRSNSTSICFMESNSTQKLESTCNNKKLSLQQNFELSLLTDVQSKLFSDDLTNPVFGEMTNPIALDFSLLQNIPASTKCVDDLDEMQENLLNHYKVNCQGPRDKDKGSKYFQVDMNLTQAEINNELSDLSLTDTINSSKVLEPNNIHTDSKVTSKKDWVADKENIAINPFAALPEDDNFTINDDSDKILFFDGKKLVLQSDKDQDPVLIAPKENRKSTVRDNVPSKPARRTIVLNTNDDLPNFGVSNVQPVCDFDASKFDPLPDLATKAETTVYDDNLYNIYISQGLHTKETLEEQSAKRKTIVFEDIDGNISMTQALPASIVVNKTGTQQTILCEDNCNISVTQMVPSKTIDAGNNKRKTIVFGDNDANISITQPIPANIVLNKTEEQRTIVDEDGCDISVTQMVPSKIIGVDNNKRKTIVFDDDDGNISVTQPIPANIVLNKTDKQHTIVDKDGCDISITQMVPSKIIGADNNKRKTIVFDHDDGNISVTQTVPANIVLNKTDNQQTFVHKDGCDISITQMVPSKIIDVDNNKRKTIVFDDDDCNISVTQAVPATIVINNTKSHQNTAYDDGCDISITQTVPSEIIAGNSNKRKTIVFDNDDGNISMTQAIPANIVINKTEKQQPIASESSCDMSVTQVLPSKIIIADSNKRKTIVFADESLDISRTQPLASNVFFSTQAKKTQRFSYENSCDIPVTPASPLNVLRGCINKSQIVLENANKPNLSLTSFENYATASSSLNNVEAEEDKIIHFDNGGKVLMSSLLPQVSLEQAANSSKRKTIVFDDNSVDISVPQAGPSNLLQDLINSTGTEKQFSEEINTAKNNTSSSNNKISMSMTKGRTDSNIFDDNNRDILISQAKLQDAEMSQSEVSVSDEKCNNDNESLVLISKMGKETNQTIDCDNNDCDVSMTELVPTNIVTNVSNDSNTLQAEREQRKVSNTLVVENLNTSVVTENDTADVSMTGFSGDNIIQKPHNSENVDLCYANTRTNALDSEIFSKTNSLLFDTDVYRISMTESKKGNIITVCQAATSKTLQHIGVENLSFENVEKHVINNDHNISTTKDQIQIVNSNLSQPNTTTIKEVLEENHVLDNEQHVNMGPKDQINAEVINVKKSIMDELLDMSDDEDYKKTEEKILISDVPPCESKERASTLDLMSAESHETPITDKRSSENLFFITRETDDEDQEYKVSTDVATETNIDTEKRRNISFSDENDSITNTPGNIEHKENLVASLQKSLNKLKNSFKIHDKNDKHNEKVISSCNDDQKEDNNSMDISLDMTKTHKSFKQADSTKELLDMLSNFVDRRSRVYNNEEVPLDEVKESIELDIKSESSEPKRLSMAPNRQSMVLNREEMLSNISMAQALLQKSRTALDVSDTLDDITTDVESTPVQKSFVNKSIRLSNEVVKTLQFDDSMSDNSFQSEKNGAPLKKTAFGESSYMKENKSKVIPSYLKVVTDDLKQLMSDLTKPTADTMPFDAAGLDGHVKRNPSTCSTQIQANLTASSQIDLDHETQSSYSSFTEVNEMKHSILRDKGMKENLHKSLKHEKQDSVRTPTKPIKNTTDTGVRYLTPTPKPATNDSDNVVLCFDPTNPLNNVMLNPIDYSKAHKYDPVRSEDTLTGSQHSKCDQVVLDEGSQIVLREETYNKQREQEMSTSYRMEINIKSPEKLTDDEMKQSLSMMSNSSRPLSLDQYTEAEQTEVKTTEVNTVIAMKDNQELLACNSSLTLVDDAIVRSTFDIEVDSGTEKSTESNNSLNSPIRVIYKIKEQDPMQETESDVTPYEEFSKETKAKNLKGKKRIYSPAKVDKQKLNTLSAVEVTPKPISKIQRISKSPVALKENIDNRNTSQEKIIDHTTTENNLDPKRDDRLKNTNKSPNKVSSKSAKTKLLKPNTTITVQQLVTEYHIEKKDLEIDQSELNVQTLGTFKDNPSTCSSESCKQEVTELMDVDSKSNEIEPKDAISFTSSKNIREISSSATSETVSSVKSKSDWQQDAMSDEQPINNIATDCDASVNVVARIDMLPFMGHECEWEQSSGDTWSFRLLHSHVRLSMRLAHRHANSRRTLVRADTPVSNIRLELIAQEKKNPLAQLSLRFASEAMRYYISLCGNKAGDIPTLLRRCAGVARVALRWGRTMYSTQLRLAYDVDVDGNLALKVANIPLRSIWEVSMKIDMVVENPQQAPWPRASDVRVSSVVAACDVAQGEATRALGRLSSDWGHVPNTVWKIFKYLKHKTNDDTMLLGLQ